MSRANTLRIIAIDPATDILTACVSEDGGRTWARIHSASHTGRKFSEGCDTVRVPLPIGSDPRRWEGRKWDNLTDEQWQAWDMSERERLTGVPWILPQSGPEE